jgi:hypothetical protein
LSGHVQAIMEMPTIYLDSSFIPNKKPVDAWHLALATTYRIDYLMTWNCSHLANPDVESKL